MKLHTPHRQLSTHEHRSIPSQTAFAFPETAIRSAIAIAAVCFLFLLGSSNLFAQAQVDTGGLTGTVTDSSGAVIPGAVVTIKNIATGVATKGLTTSTGRYIFGAVPPGTYTLEVIKTGFGPYSASGIVVHIQQIPTVDVVLNPGAVSQTVTVSDAVPLMQAESAEVKQTITGAAVNDLPLSTRDWTSLGQLSAGVTTTAGGTTSSSYYSVNGQSFNQNDFRLNGIDDNVEMFPSSVHGTNAAILPPPDAIQEFTLQSGDFSSEFGHSLGGIVNAVVKSGTNKVHGDVWEYLRNEAFNANDYFSKQSHKPIPEYRQNQFGGTIGGPLVIPHLYDGHNKTFFFFDYQGTRIITPSNSFSTVPTANMIASNFTNLQDLITFNAGTRTDALGRIFPLGTVFDPATTRTVAAGAVDPISGFQNTTSSPVFVRDPFFTGGSIAGINDFTGRASQLNILPASRLDPNAIALLKLYPAPSANGFSNNYFQTAKGTVNRNQFDIRGDERINDRDTVFGVYSWYHSSTFTPNPLPGIADGAGLFGFAGLVDYPIWEIAGGYTHVFTPTLVNDFHVGYNHAYQNQNSNEANLTGLPEKFGIPGVPQAAGNGGLPNIGISGLASLGVSGFTPTYHTLKALQLNDGVSWSRGAHNLKTGFEIVEIGGTALQPVASRGSLTFNGQYTSIPNKNAGLTGISDMLIVPGPSSVNGANNIGGLSSFQASNFSLMDYHRRYVAAYAQDNWRATRNLTLNLGLRWDYFGPQYDLNGKYANVVFNNGGNGPGGIFYLPNKTCNYPRSATFDQLLAKDNINIQCVGNNLYTAPYTNFAPRVGFAYQVASRFVARGGYGIAYSSLSPRGTGQQLGQNYPFEYTLGFSNTNPVAPFLLGNGAPTTMENAIASLNIQDPSNVSGRGASLFGSQYNFQTPYTETANLTLQYGVTRNSTVSAGYVGEFGRHLQVENVHNSPSQIVPPGASISAFIPAPDFSPNSIYQTTNGSSSYNSLQTVYQLRDSHGDSVLANYTYGKCMQDANQFQAGLSYRAPWLPGFGIHRDYQLCGSDATHVVHGSGTYNLPFGRGKRWLASNGFADAIVGGWIVNAIYTYQSGQPFTVGCPIRTNAFFGCNANLVPGQSLYAGPHNQTQWLNPNAFANPPVATTAGASVDVLGGTGAQARGPGYSNLDTSLFKQFPLHESFRLEFRAEAFNAFNTAQFANPSNLDFTNKTKFSQITGLRGNARVLQLALKLFY